MIDPTVIRGLSDAYGSWKMICISLRSARSERLSSVVTFCAPNQTSPDVGSMSRRIERPVVDLPQPDSPTRPSVSPGRISNDTSSTACTRATSRERRRSEEHTSELQSQSNLVCRLLLEKKKKMNSRN